MSRKISELKPEEILALAIHLERANGRHLRLFADAFEGRDPEAAQKFRELAAEENRHEEWLLEKFKRRFTGPVPSVGEFDVEGVMEILQWEAQGENFYEDLKGSKIFQLALESENRARKFYQDAVPLTNDKSVSLLFRVLAAMEQDHVDWLVKKIKDANTNGAILGGKP